MATLNDLTPLERAHWKLHLNAAMKDTPSAQNEAKAFLEGEELPKIKHPSTVHDWLEQPQRRAELEKYG